ncbi:hypothetical protein AC578_6811 [Pseudocercospora eumusae]|uniref:Uncharacterized protein n=1 Tax=Pseudocercospora eumusae TaxID=321146 RepID=A0A139GW85_9PEZI|nr:hypothetical protein AC578_6811 [Pseudocercospora eumusae]
MNQKGGQARGEKNVEFRQVQAYYNRLTKELYQYAIRWRRVPNTVADEFMIERRHVPMCATDRGRKASGKCEGLASSREQRRARSVGEEALFHRAIFRTTKRESRPDRNLTYATLARRGWIRGASFAPWSGDVVKLLGWRHQTFTFYIEATVDKFKWRGRKGEHRGKGSQDGRSIDSRVPQRQQQEERSSLHSHTRTRLHTSTTSSQRPQLRIPPTPRRPGRSRTNTLPFPDTISQLVATTRGSDFDSVAPKTHLFANC